MSNPYNDNFQSGGYFFNPIRRDIAMIQGDTMSFAFQVQGLKGEIPNEIIFTCKDTPESDTPLFGVSLEDNISLQSYDGEHDILTYVLRIPPNLTNNIALGRYYYDLQVSVNYDILTLMRGRLSIEYQITTGSVEPTPQYEDGDGILYPLPDIPLSSKKIYTEVFVSDIAEALNTVLNNSETYELEDMAPAIRSIKTGLNYMAMSLIITTYEEV